MLFLWLPPQDEVPKNASRQSLPCAGQPTTMNQLTESFNIGRIPSPAEMTGSWMAIGFLDRTPSFNCDGVKRLAKLQWVMLAHGYAAETDMIGTQHQKTSMTPDDNGSLILSINFGGDTAPEYRCRLTDRMTLACIFQGRAAKPVGVEFKKISVR